MCAQEGADIGENAVGLVRALDAARQDEAADHGGEGAGRLPAAVGLVACRRLLREAIECRADAGAQLLLSRALGAGELTAQRRDNAAALWMLAVSRGEVAVGDRDQRLARRRRGGGFRHRRPRPAAGEAQRLGDERIL